MKKWLATVLLAILATGSFAAGIPSGGVAVAAVAQTSKESQFRKPVHEMVVFNDYQVVGLSANGWNWVRNDEFILPPDTPLDIDLVYTLYGNGPTLGESRVFLDGAELPQYQHSTISPNQTFRWQVPRFTIPASELSAGVHTLTFVVTDGSGNSGTVHVRFRVEAKNYPLIHEVGNATGEAIGNGDVAYIFGMYGSKSFASESPGEWSLTNKSNGSVLKTFAGWEFSTGTILAGEYELLFIPDDINQFPWKITLQVGPPSLYLGKDETGRKLSPNQKIVAENAPGTVSLYSPSPGNWWVEGTEQALYGSQYFDVDIPKALAGMTMSVTFKPNQVSGTAWGDEDTAVTIQIQVPGQANACALDSPVTMDLLVQNNKHSSLLTEQRNLYSSDRTVRVYQDPIYSVWIGTAEDHIKYGSAADAEEGPGIWAVNSVIVDSSRLNWDHTALNLSEYGAGRYQIHYYNKENPSLSWCGYVELIEDTPPISSSAVCEVGDSGKVPSLQPVRLQTGSGREFGDGDRLELKADELDDLTELKLLATHVELYGTKTVKREKGSKDRRFLTLPDTNWEYGEVPFGAINEFGSSPIRSRNKVVVYHDGEEVARFRSSLKEDEPGEGWEKLDLKSIIEQNGLAGEYTVEVTNELSYLTCSIISGGRSSKKVVREKETEQKMVFTVAVEE